MRKIIIGLIALLFILLGCNGNFLFKTSNEVEPVTEMSPTSNVYANDTYEVGLEMPAGEYTLETIDDELAGYYAISKDEFGEKLTKQRYFTDFTTVTVDDGQFLILMNARTNS